MMKMIKMMKMMWMVKIKIKTSFPAHAHTATQEQATARAPENYSKIQIMEKATFDYCDGDHNDDHDDVNIATWLRRMMMVIRMMIIKIKIMTTPGSGE